jgi:hypothetical protein
MRYLIILLFVVGCADLSTGEPDAGTVKPDAWQIDPATCDPCIGPVPEVNACRKALTFPDECRWFTCDTGTVIHLCPEGS